MLNLFLPLILDLLLAPANLGHRGLPKKHVTDSKLIASADFFFCREFAPQI